MPGEKHNKINNLENLKKVVDKLNKGAILVHRQQ